MATSKRQRLLTPAGPKLDIGAGIPTESIEWQAELTKDLPASVLGSVVTTRLINPVTQGATQAAIMRCREEAGCTLQEQMQQLIEQSVEEPDEKFSRKMGSLAGSLYEFEGLLSKAQQWIQLGGYEAAFQLVWACVTRTSDWEERGSDGGGWEDFDERADALMLAALKHMDNWGSVKLSSQIADMKDVQKSASAFGYEHVCKMSLPKLEFLAELA